MTSQLTYCRGCYRSLQIEWGGVDPLGFGEEEFILCPKCHRSTHEILLADYRDKRRDLTAYEVVLESIRKDELSEAELEAIRGEILTIGKVERFLEESYVMAIWRGSHLREELLRLRECSSAQTGHGSLASESFSLANDFARIHSEEFLAHVKAFLWSMHRRDDELVVFDSVSILNELFHIWFDGLFGTINGLRIGTLHSIRVEWEEINAGMGLLCLLVKSLARVAGGFEFSENRAELRPRGSRSTISFTQASGRPIVRDLYYCRNRRSFNKGLVGLLHCVRQLVLHCSGMQSESQPTEGTPDEIPDADCPGNMHANSSLQRNYSVPYVIEDDRLIGSDGIGVCIQYCGTGVREEGDWTCALKYLLSDLKWLIAVVAVLFRVGESEL